MTDQTATIITGAASGIGAALVRRLSNASAQFTLHTRHSVERLEAVAQAAREAGAEVETVTGDLADAGTGAAIVEAHRARFGRLDNLVANAGFPLLKSLDEMTAKDVAYAFAGNSTRAC